MSAQPVFPPRPIQGIVVPTTLPATLPITNQPTVSTPMKISIPSFSIPSLRTTPQATKTLSIPKFSTQTSTLQIPSLAASASSIPSISTQTSSVAEDLFKPRKAILPSRVPVLMEIKAPVIPVTAEVKAPVVQDTGLFKPRTVTIPSSVPASAPETKTESEEQIPSAIIPPSLYEAKTGPRKSVTDAFREVTQYRDILATDPRSLTTDAKGIKNAKTQPKAFFDYLGKLLSIFIKDPPGEKRIGTLPNIVATMLEPKYQKTWVRAWTHSSAEPDLNKNYETLEAIGDKALGKAFKFYLFRKNPNVTPEELNEYESRYMSKEFQPAISDAFRMSEWVIVHKDIDPRDVEHSFPSIKEDVYEAFCGALSIISDDIYAGFGDANVSNFLTEFFNNIVIDPRLAKGKGITKFIQYYERVAGKPKEGGGAERFEVANRDDTTRQWEVKIVPPDFDVFVQKVQKIQGSGFHPFQLPLGVGRAENKTAATFAAFDHALDTLAEHGINEEWTKRYRNEMIINRIGRAEYDRALMKASEMKFPDSDVGQIVRLEFTEPRTTNVTDMAIIILTGVDKNQKRVNIEVGTYHGKEKEEFLAKKIIEKFLKRVAS